MGLAFVTIENPVLVLALRAGAVAGQVNDLIAELESQPEPDAALIVEAYVAYHTLNRIALPLFDRAIESAKALGHYTALANQTKADAA
jgi:hypothetical protein